MSSEIKTPQRERVAYLESQQARVDRQLLSRPHGPQLDQFARTRMVRTQGDDPDDVNDATYPLQVDGQGCRLPIVFLDVVYDEDADDPVTLVPRATSPQAWLYSPFGWIPRLIDLEVTWQTGYNQPGIWVVSFVPELEVKWIDMTNAGARGTVELVRHGVANGQQFEAWFDHMAGANFAQVNDDAIVKLREGRKVWATPNKEC